MSAKPLVVDVDTKNFTSVVIDGSFQAPVLVDFWAKWCGPCKVLGPILERLAAEMEGAFTLAKIDTDAQPAIAQQLGIQSLPTVKLVVRGQLIDEFQGALPEAHVRAFLAHHGIGEKGDPAQRLAEDLLAQGDLDGAEQVLRERLASLSAANAPASERNELELFLAEVQFERGDLAAARATLEALPPSLQDGERGRVLRAALALGAEKRDDGELAALAAAAQATPSDLAARITYGKALGAAGRHEEALRTLMDTVYVDRDFDTQAARRAMLEIFDALGRDTDLAVEYRRELQMALYV